MLPEPRFNHRLNDDVHPINQPVFDEARLVLGDLRALDRRGMEIVSITVDSSGRRVHIMEPDAELGRMAICETLDSGCIHCMARPTAYLTVVWVKR